MTLRRTAFQSCIRELLWIWQKKSNNIHDLGSHIWDSWADETGSIGKAYGYQLGVKYQYPEGEFDQVDRVLYDLKHNPPPGASSLTCIIFRTSMRCTCTPAPIP